MDITLKSVTRDDIELIRTWRNSEEISSYMYTDDKIEKSQQEKWFEKISKDKNSRYWIIQYDNRKLGLASLNNIDNILNSCYWAFYLGDLSIRGAGIGSKVEYNVLNYVFEELKLNKLRCEVFVFNDKVIKMHEKFGFRREAYYREQVFKNGKFQDVVGLAILKSEWLKQKDLMYKTIYREK